MYLEATGFDRRLRYLLAISGISREELARRLDVSVPVVSRWISGVSLPDVYQFRAISQFFAMPYEWFLEDAGGVPNTEELAALLGLREGTIAALLDMVSEGGNEAALEAVDDTLRAALGIIDGVFEDLDRYAGEVVAEMEENRK